MARKQQSLKSSNSIEYTVGAPSDARTIVELKSDLTDSASFPYPYEGLPVYCKEDKKLYILKGDDPTDAASWEEIGGGGGKFTQDVLWEGSATTGTLSLSRPITDYDELVFSMAYGGEHQMPKTFMSNDIVIGTTICGDNMTNSAYLWGMFDDATTYRITGAAGGATIYKITGIKLSSLDGTIGRWEKIGAFNPNTTNNVPNLSDYNFFSMTLRSSGGENVRNACVVSREDAESGESMFTSELADGTRYAGTIFDFNAGTIRVTGSGAISKVVVYGYKETAISDADVQRIAAQVRPVPDGGTTGQALVKLSDADGDADWDDVKIDVDQTYDATSTNPQSGTAVAEAVADKQDVLTAGRGVEILPDGTINMTKNLMRHTDVLWEGSYGDVRAGAITLSSSITEYDEICIVMGNAFQAVAQTLGLVSLRCNNDYVQSASAYAYIIVSFNGNTATVDGAKKGQNGDSRYLLKSPLTNVLGIKYDTTGGGGDVDSALSDTSENPVQNKIIKAELDKKAEGYIVPEILTPVDLETAGQPSFMRAGQIFMLSQRGVVGGQRYTFTQADVDNLVNVTDQNGITFTVTSSEGDSTQITMLGTPPSNVIYMPNMALSETTAAFLIDPEEVHQIDARLIPGGGGGAALPTGGTTGQALVKKSNADGDAEWKDVGGTGGGNANFDISTVPLGGAGVYEVNAFLNNNDSERVRAIYSRGVNGELPDWFTMSVTSGLGTDDFHVATKEYADKEVAKKGNAKITFDNEYQYLQIRDDNGTDIGFSQETANTVRVQEYAKDSRGQVQPIFDETLPSKAYVDGALSSLDTKVTANTDAMTNLLSRTYATKGAYNSLIQDCDNFIYPDSTSATYRVFMQSLEKKGSRNVIDYCYEISFNDGSDSVLVWLNVSEYKFDFGTSVTSKETYEAKDRDGNLVCYFYEVYRSASNGAWGIYFIAPDKNHSAGGSSETLGNRIAQIEAYEPKTIYRVSGYVEEDYGLDDIEDNVTDMQNAIGDLATLTTTDQTNLVGAINEIDFAVKGLGEPFRVKSWASNTLNVEIPYCTEDIGNGSIAKMVYSIDDVEGADYQIVGMIAYEVFDAASGGSRINCWPVCQFTGNGQKELSVRWMCGGTTRKTAKRINAWVLLKHR